MRNIFLGVCALAGVAFTGCGEADKLFDCNAVCNKYKTCFNDKYDVGACRNRCKDKADADKSFQQKADVCESCIDGKSCAGSAFSCTTECAGIVP